MIKTTDFRHMTKSIAFLSFLALILLSFNCHTPQSGNANAPQSEKKVTEPTSTPKSRSLPAFQAYTCNGNEPFWNIKVEQDKITFRLLGETPVVYPYSPPSKSGQITQFETSTLADGKKSILKFTLEEKSCVDNMSGKSSPLTVRAEKDGKTFQGCGDRT